MSKLLRAKIQLDSKYTGEHIYDLYATVNHMGVAGGGHYTSFCQYKEDNKWFVKDDSRSWAIEDIASPYVYILFYKKR